MVPTSQTASINGVLCEDIQQFVAQNIHSMAPTSLESIRYDPSAVKTPVSQPASQVYNIWDPGSQLSILILRSLFEP